VSKCDLFKLDCEGSEAAILRALAAAGLMRTVGWVTGEWQVGGRRERAAVVSELKRIVRPTHRIEFSARQSGREGYFTASPLCPADPM